MARIIRREELIGESGYLVAVIIMIKDTIATVGEDQRGGTGDTETVTEDVAGIAHHATTGTTTTDTAVRGRKKHSTSFRRNDDGSY